MILKEYQKQTLATVQDYLERLDEWREKAAKLLEMDPDYDWVQRAWSKTVTGRVYIPRRNGLGEPLPAFCLKIPTGGGKTLLAIKVIDLVNIQYRRRQTGLVLWIVPTTQIYNQTLRALKDRDHFYRQQLDLASAGRTLILEKTSGFSPADVRENLCVLLLMLPSANRETKASLRMFRDSGGFERFFPPDDDVAAQRRLLGERAEPRCVRGRRRSLGTPNQDIARQYTAPAQAPHRAGRRATRRTASTPRPRWRASTRA